MFSLCIIPAKGNSTRIPYKNLKTVGDRPLIVRTLETAIYSYCFDKIVVSTEDDEIAHFVNYFRILSASKEKIDISMRHPDYATKQSPVIDTILQVARHIVDLYLFDYLPEDILISYMLPTCPFMNRDLVKKAFEIYISNREERPIYNKYQSVVSAYDCTESCILAMREIENNEVLPIHKNLIQQKTNSLFQKERYFRPNGGIYLTSFLTLDKYESYFWPTCNINIVEMDKFESINIDEPLDLEIANFLSKHREI